MNDKDFAVMAFRAERCTTHHYGCDCREYERIKALRTVEEQAKEIERLRSLLRDALPHIVGELLEAQAGEEVKKNVKQN